MKKGDKQGKSLEEVNPVGRPTKYIPDVIYPKITEYLTMVSKPNMSLPSIVGLANHLDVDPDTIYEWASGRYSDKHKNKKLRGKLKHPEFSVTLKKIASRQKQQLMDDGMYGGKEVNAAMAIFLLKVNHGLTEGPGVKVQVNVFDRLAKDDKEFVEGEEVK